MPMRFAVPGATPVNVHVAPARAWALSVADVNGPSPVVSVA